MHAIQLAALLAAVYCGLWFLPGSDPLEAGYPQEAAGDIRFRVDPVRFLNDGAEALEVFVALPEGAFEAESDSFRIMALVEMLGRDGSGLAEFSTEMVIPPVVGRDSEAAFPVPLRWLRLYPAWLPGTQGIRVQVQDLTRMKAGLLDRVRGRHLEGTTSGHLGPGPGSLRQLEWLSDLLFVWGPETEPEAADVGEPGLRSVRSRLQPNPHRYYGLHNEVLTIYWEQYPPPPGSDADPGDSLVLRQRIIDRKDDAVVFASAETLGVRASADWTLRRYDLAGLPGGAYEFELSLEDAGPGGGLLASSGGLFQVIWEESNWKLDESEVLALGRVVLPARDYEDFEELDRGEQERYLRDLWNREAPTRPGEPNPVEEKLMERARFAAERFGERLRPGILSDRGRVYIRYGEPDVIRTNLNPQDEELLVHLLAREVYDDGFSDGLEGQRLSKRRTRYDNSAYTIWEYNLRGDPLLSDYVDHTSKMGLKFIFVDELGIGDFHLVYTNAPGVLH